MFDRWRILRALVCINLVTIATSFRAFHRPCHGPVRLSRASPSPSNVPLVARGRSTVRAGDSPLIEAEPAAKPDTIREALTTLGMVLALAAAFDGGVLYFKGATAAVDFVAGFLVEESLSVDNLFVFVLLFEYFKVPLAYQGRVLRYGILGAVVLRGLFIGLGVVALESFKPVLLVFAGVLIASSAKLLFAGDDDDDDDLTDNAIVKLATNWVNATPEYDGDRFFTSRREKVEADNAFAAGGEVEAVVSRATPLLLVLVCVELSDIVFAVDSVPAVFGVTQDPFIVFSSNIFAILGLRSIFAILSEAVENLPYLQPAVAVVLGFVGAKLAAEYFGVDVPNEVSLGVILSLLGVGVGAGFVLPKPEDKKILPDEKSEG